MKRIILSIILSLVLSRGVAYAETSLKAQVDKKAATTDELISYKVSVISTGDLLSAPQFPDFNGFKVVSQGQSSSLSFAKGGMNSETAYIFTLAPIEPGEIEISPARLKTKEGELASDSFIIKVKQGDKPLRPAPPEKSPIPQELLRGTQDSQATL
jgi:hypothetical protein